MRALRISTASDRSGCACEAVSVAQGGRTTTIDSPLLTVQLEPGSGETLVLTMKRYANAPTVLHPWQRKEP